MPPGPRSATAARPRSATRNIGLKQLLARLGIGRERGDAARPGAGPARLPLADRRRGAPPGRDHRRLDGHPRQPDRGSSPRRRLRRGHRCSSPTTSVKRRSPSPSPSARRWRIRVPGSHWSPPTAASPAASRPNSAAGASTSTTRPERRSTSRRRGCSPALWPRRWPSRREPARLLAAPQASLRRLRARAQRMPARRPRARTRRVPRPARPQRHRPARRGAGRGEGGSPGRGRPPHPSRPQAHRRLRMERSGMAGREGRGDPRSARDGAARHPHHRRGGGRRASARGSHRGFHRSRQTQHRSLRRGRRRGAGGAPHRDPRRVRD